jgi:hypothetical protein
MAKNLAGILVVSISALLFAGCGGGSSEQVVPETTTTTIAPLTGTQIAALLPTGTELPLGWSSKGAEVFTAADTTTPGNCGGPNAAARAVAQGLIQYVRTEYVSGSPGSRTYVSVYGFPTADAAHNFVVASSAQSVTCPNGFEETTDGENGAKYLSQSKVSVGSAVVPSAAESFSLYIDDAITVVGTSSNYDTSLIAVYSRVGDVVFVVSMSGFPRQERINNIPDLFRPQIETVNSATEHIVKNVTQRLGARPGLTPSTTTTIN